jgi:hypothetical protein
MLHHQPADFYDPLMQDRLEQGGIVMSSHLYHWQVDDHVPGPPCPTCEGDNTVCTEERAGERRYYCADCSHRWSMNTNPPDDRDALINEGEALSRGHRPTD